MNAASANSRAASRYHGDNKLVLGIVLAVVTFWLFAQTTLNVAPAMRDDLRIAESVNNIAISITALFSGIFIVIEGGLADRFGRVKLTNVGIVLGILGSLLIALSPVGTATFLLIGRVIQGISAACIMPSTLALMKAYFDGEARQRALSFWSIGSWGGSGLRGTPESKAEMTTHKSSDWPDVIAFVVAMVSVNILIGQGSALGWVSSTVLALAVVFVVSIIVFFRIEIGNANAFVDLALFRNATFSGATLSNLLLNGAAGTLLVVLTLVQEGAGLSSLQAGLLTVGYLIGVLATIRIGEKLLQRMGPRKPMLLGCWITGGGILLTTLTFVLVGGRRT